MLDPEPVPSIHVAPCRWVILICFANSGFVTKEDVESGIDTIGQITMKKILLLVSALFAAPQAIAQYRCVENGKTILQDHPCIADAGVNTPAPKSGNVIGDSAYSTTNGAWRGQVQFVAKSGPAVISEAHMIAPLVIDIDPKGKVTGSASEAGCVLKGIAKPGIVPTIAELDVTLSKCSYSGYDQRMRGRVALYTEKRYVDFSLVAYDINKRPPRYYEIKGTLRR